MQKVLRRHGLSPFLSQILVKRRLTEPEHIEKFLQPSLAHLPDPALLSGMTKAVERLVHAVKYRELITVYGDYDVDGSTSTALLIDFFRSIGAQANYYIPHRLREGYSLHAQALQRLASQGSRVVLTVDNGISAYQEAELARELGLDLIITDHHEVPAQIPRAYSIINPKLPGDPFPGKELAGVGIAFYLLIALRRALRDHHLLPDREPNLRQGLDLVAVGTIADLAPLVGVNRILVKEGLKVLNRSPRLGLKALIRAANLSGEIQADKVGFYLGPRINAVGRLEEASTGVELLLCTQEERAAQLAAELDRANLARQDIEDEIAEEAMRKIEQDRLAHSRRSLVLFNESWHPGVVGIVASRLVEKYHLPSVVLSREPAGLKGSARSIKNLSLIETLQDCAEHLVKFGGHRYAAGLSLREENLDRFSEAFDRAVRARLHEEDFLPSLRVDIHSGLEMIDSQLLAEFEMLQPFGAGNAQPVLMSSGVKIQQRRILGEKHVKLRLGEGRTQFSAIGFRLAEKMPPHASTLDIAFVPEWNEWNQARHIELRLLDLRSAKAS